MPYPCSYSLGVSRGLRVPIAATIACAALAVLPVAALADDVPAEAVVADLPFLNVPGSSRIHLDLALPGEPPFPVLLDTGFAYALGSPLAIRKIGGEPLNESKSDVVRDTALGVPVTVRESEIPSDDAQDHSWVRLGGEALRTFIVEIDFEKRRVRFIDREKFALADAPASADRATLPIYHMAYRPFMAIEVNGRETTVAIDTTVTLPLTIGVRDLARAAVHPKSLPVLRPQRGGERNTRLFETDAVRIGPFAFGALPVFVAQQGQRDALGPSGAAIGLDLLVNFKVRLDLMGRELWLERTRTDPIGFGGQSYAYTRSSGLFLGPLGHQWVVLGVLPGSPAEAAGLEADDRIERERSPFTDARIVQEAVRKQKPLMIERRVGGEVLKLIAPTQTVHWTDAPANGS